MKRTARLALVRSFDRVLGTDELPAAVGASIGRECEPLGVTLPGADPLPVRLLLRAARAAGGARGRVLVLTSRPITAANSLLFGYADRRRRVALVSTAALGFDSDILLASARLHNVLTHECAHLDGLRHCRTPGCVMAAVRTVQELDARRDVPCGACPRAGEAARWAGAALVLLALLALTAAGLDGIARALAPAPREPFACMPGRGPPGLHLYFKGRPVAAELPGASGLAVPACRSTATANALNRLFQQVIPPPLVVTPALGGRALVSGGGSVLFEARASGGRRDATVRALARQIDGLLLAKGWPGDGCPECHADRPSDMSSARRARTGG